MTSKKIIKGNNKFYAVIPAAGKGSRMGIPVNKQFLELDGIPVLARTLSEFEHADLIDGILVSGNAEEIPLLQELCRRYGISKLIGVVEGGQTRQQSVTNALEFLIGFRKQEDLIEDVHDDPGARIEDECEVYVLIHDGARPFVTRKIINACVQEVVLHGACICGVPVKDTIKVVDKDGRIESTVPREGLWAVQTPQAFSLLLISAMHKKAASLGLDFTDDAQVAEYFGLDVYMIKGDYSNIKITTPEDLLHGEMILQQKKQG